VLWHTADACFLTTPADSQALFNNLQAAGVTAAFDAVSGGVTVTSPPASLDLCGALHFHGFLGIEPTAVGKVTAWLDGRVAALAGNGRPEAPFATVTTAAGTPKAIDLSPLARDADGDALTYALSHSVTSRGGTVSVTGSTATYTPPGGLSNATDYFVY